MCVESVDRFEGGVEGDCDGAVATSEEEMRGRAAVIESYLVCLERLLVMGPCFWSRRCVYRNEAIVLDKEIN